MITFVEFIRFFWIALAVGLGASVGMLVTVLCIALFSDVAESLAMRFAKWNGLVIDEPVTGSTDIEAMSQDTHETR